MNALGQIEPTSEAGALARINLERHADYARGAYASNTERALRADVAIFSGWCAAAGLSPLPATADTLVQFVDTMAASKAPATIRRYVSSVATFHRAAGLTSPTEALEVKLALKRLHREKGRAQAQAAPLTRNLVGRMLEAAGAGGARALRNRALLAVAYDTLCRRSELAAFERADLEIGPQGDGTLTVRRSKTDQEGAGMVRYLAPDTMREVQAWLAASKVADGALFRSVNKVGVIGGPIDGGDVPRIFKKMALAAGIAQQEASRISGHSSRVGAAQDMVRHGVELPAVMQAGGWRTAEMVGRYTRTTSDRHSSDSSRSRRYQRFASTISATPTPRCC